METFEKILEEHFPGADRADINNAAYELHTATSYVLMFGWGSAADRKSLVNAKKALSRLSEALSKISPEIMRDLKQEIDESPISEEFTSPKCWEYSLNYKRMLALLENGLDAAVQFEASAEDRGGANLNAAFIVDSCRIVWRDMTGKPPPNHIHANAQGPLVSFVGDVLKAYKENIQVASAFDIWREKLSGKSAKK